MESSVNETTMTRYLLGDLPEQEAVALEDRFFRDDAFFEELRAAEADLIDQYVRGELSKATSQQFEKHFLKSAARRQRVEFAKALAGAVTQSQVQTSVAATTPKPQGTLIPLRSHLFPKWLAIAATMLAVAGASVMVQNRRLARQVDSLQAGRSSEDNNRRELEARVKELQSLNAQLSKELEKERSNSQPNGSNVVASLVAFVLSPGMVRGTDEPSRIVVPNEISQVKLQLDLETVGDYLSYRGELRTAGGQLLWSQDGLHARSTSWGKAVVLILPAVVLAPGEHELTLRGLVSRGKFEDSGYYYFSVSKR